MKRAMCVASVAACAAAIGAAASAAATKTTTMHFFSKQVYGRLSDANGRPLGANAAPKPGDRFSFASDDYVGNHKHHAKEPTASDHVVCTVTRGAKGLCDGTISIGGSMLLGDDFVLDFASNRPTRVKITGGTGRYKHARGTVIATTVSQTANDLTIKVR